MKRIFLLIGSSILFGLMLWFMFKTSIFPFLIPEPSAPSLLRLSFPAILMLFGFLLSVPGASAVIPLIFLLWCSHLFVGVKKIPLRTYVLFWIIVLLSVIYFILGWTLAMQYQGIKYTAVVVVFNLVIALILLWLGQIAQRKPSFIKNLAYHFILFAWLSLLAFPSFGELP